MDYEIQQGRLRVRLIRDFNLLTARQLEKLAVDASAVSIDLTRAKIVDSVAIITLHRLIKEGKKVTLINPPRIFGEAVRVLGVDDVLKMDELVEKGD